MASFHDLPMDAVMCVARMTAEQYSLKQALSLGCVCTSARAGVNAYLAACSVLHFADCTSTTSIAPVLTRARSPLARLALIGCNASAVPASFLGCKQLDLTRSCPPSALARTIHSSKPRLTAVDLSGTTVDRTVVYELCDDNYSDGLSELYLTRCNASAPIEHLMRLLLAHSYSLRFLDVSETKPALSALSMVLLSNHSALPSLVHLAASASESSSTRLLEPLAHGACPKLQHLNLSCINDLDDATLRSISTSHPHLEHVELIATAVSDPSPLLLNCRKLEGLDLRRSLVNLSVLTEGLRQAGTLNHLNALLASGFGAGSLSAFARTLSDCAPSLTTLMLSEMHSTLVDDCEAATALPLTLRTLMMDSTPSPAFISALASNRELRHLAMDAEKMQRYHLQQLAKHHQEYLHDLKLESVSKTASKQIVELAPLRNLQRLLVTGVREHSGGVASLLRSGVPALKELNIIAREREPSEELVAALNERRRDEENEMMVRFNFKQI